MAKVRSPRVDAEDLKRFGPRLEVEVGPPFLDAGSRKLMGTGQSSRMPALIDVGAGRTVVTPAVVRNLGLPVVSYTTLSRAGGIDRVSIHVVSLRFPRHKLKPIDAVQVLCCELPAQAVQCLLGRDVLANWEFTYKGKTGQWSIDEDETAPADDRALWIEPPREGGNFDVFISHASEDKEFVDPLVVALKAAGISVWYDKDRMTWGDNLRTSIDRGLLNSRFGVVVLSKSFLRKKRWTEHELNGLFAKERLGEKVILPIWHKVTQDDLAEYSAPFVDRIAMDSQKDSIPEIAVNLKRLLGRMR